jgi:DNA-binding NarL/FixJ family response regulator
MKVLLVDDNRLMLEGLQNLLEVHGIEVAGLAKDGQEAISLARKLKPDVILMDIRMPVLNGLEATRLIKTERPESKIIILTTSAEDQDLFDAVKSGAYGYLLKDIDADELIESLDQVQQGIPPFSPGLAVKLCEEFARLAKFSEMAQAVSSGESANATGKNGLTARQTEVLTLVSQGLPYKEVGDRLGLTTRTIKYHMAGIMQQLHLQNRAQVLAYVSRMGWKIDKPNKVISTT